MFPSKTDRFRCSMIPVMSRFPLPTATLVSTWKIPGDEDGFNAGINCPLEERKLKIRVSSNAIYDLPTHLKNSDRSRRKKHGLLAVDSPLFECGFAWSVLLSTTIRIIRVVKTTVMTRIVVDKRTDQR